MDNLEHCFTVIGLSETWLNPTNVSAYGISGYNHVHRTRNTRKGGGVSLFVSEKCIYSEMANHCMVNDCIESLFVKITNNGMTFVIGIVYRPPNSDIVQFTETLNDILGEVSHMPCYIMGDYNIDLSKNELHPPTEKFHEVMYSNSLLLGFVRTRVLMSRSRLNNGATHGGWHFDIHRDFDTRGR